MIQNDYSPLLHLRSRNIDAICLATTAHREVDIEVGETKTLVALGNDVECRRVVEDVVVEREVTAENVTLAADHPRNVLRRTWG